MKKTDSLGQFEQLVLTSVLSLRDKAYGVTIHRKVSELAERPVTLGAVYITLDRLEHKRYITSRLADASPERGGRPKRYYRMLASGDRVLREALNTARRLHATAEKSWKLESKAQKRAK